MLYTGSAMKCLPETWYSLVQWWASYQKSNLLWFSGGQLTWSMFFSSSVVSCLPEASSFLVQWQANYLDVLLWIKVSSWSPVACSSPVQGLWADYLEHSTLGLDKQLTCSKFFSDSQAAYLQHVLFLFSGDLHTGQHIWSMYFSDLVMTSLSKHVHLCFSGEQSIWSVFFCSSVVSSLSEACTSLVQLWAAYIL